jgi:hypothetical protein
VTNVTKGADQAVDQYIETSSPHSLFHVCFGGMAFFYLVNLPWERAHLEKHGGKH